MAEISSTAGVETEKRPEDTAVGSSSSNAEDDIPRPELPPLRFWLLALGLCLGLFLSFIDSSIVATSLVSIGTEFDDLARVNWVALSYTLSYLGCAVLFARISDIIGRRDAFIAAFVIFFGFSIGCGFARNLDQLIACRAFQGLGGSGLYSITMIIFPEVSPDRLKQFLGSVVGLVIAIGGVLGPILGGVLTHYSTWRWIFWINGPIGAVSMVLFYLTWPKAEYLPDLERRTWRELDYLGSALLVVSSVLVVFAFQNAGGASTDVWKQARFLAPLIAGVLGWVGLIVWEIWADRRWGDRIAAGFPMRLMRNHVYGATVVNTIFLGFPFIMLVYAFPLRVQIVNGKGALLAGVMLLPMLGASATGSVVAGVINGKKDRVFETLAASSCFVTLGCGLLSTLSSSINVEAKGLGFLVFVGFGFGMSAAGCTMVANLKASIRDHAPSQGIIAQVRILGGSIGIAASAAILGVTLRTQLRGIVNPDQLASLESHPDDFSQIQLDSIRKAYSDAFSEDMRVCAVVAGVAIVLSLGTWSRNRPSVQEILSGHVREEKERRKIVKSPT